jgi:hypothetical protein
MEDIDIFETIRNDNLIKYLKFKRINIKNENELNLIDLKIKELESSIINTKQEVKKNDTELFFEKLDNEVNKYALFKSWNRLTHEQKKDQLIIYIDNLIQAENIDYVKKVVLEYLDAGMINSSKYIQYNSKEAKISSIKFLEYDNDTNKYKIQLNLKKTSSI